MDKLIIALSTIGSLMLILFVLTDNVVLFKSGLVVALVTLVVTILYAAADTRIDYFYQED